MGADKNNQNNMGQNRQPQHQSGGMSQQNPSQQQQQKDKLGQGGQAGQGGQRVDTDGDGRTRDPSDKRPTDQGGKAPPVQR
ncbi:MAG: hypothetical protein JSR98_03690 [Proteobacteria bacterium]|nr:hypothetical protein [Pseudomonadota bacterium]